MQKTAMQKTAFRRLPLGELIRKFSVSFRLRPAYAGASGVGPEIGCEVELIGQHYCMGKHVGPGCPHCLEVLLVLLELHDRSLAGQDGPCSVERLGAQCEKLIHYASASGDWPEVALDVKIIRRRNLQQVPEGWVVKITDHIRTELLELGCHEVPSVYVPAELVADNGRLFAERAV